MSSSRGAWHALKPCPKSLVPQLHVTENLIVGDGEDHLLVSCVICICGIVSGATRDVITMQLSVLTVVSSDSEDDDVREMYLGTATNYDRCQRLSQHVHMWVHRRHYVRCRRRAFVGGDGRVTTCPRVGSPPALRKMYLGSTTKYNTCGTLGGPRLGSPLALAETLMSCPCWW